MATIRYDFNGAFFEPHNIEITIKTDKKIIPNDTTTTTTVFVIVDDIPWDPTGNYFATQEPDIPEDTESPIDTDKRKPRPKTV